MIPTNEDLEKFFDSLSWDSYQRGRHIVENCYLEKIQQTNLFLYWILPNKNNFKLGKYNYVTDGSMVERVDPLRIVEENKILKYFRKTRKLE